VWVRNVVFRHECGAGEQRVRLAALSHKASGCACGWVAAGSTSVSRAPLLVGAYGLSDREQTVTALVF
jgi:hypothetical protein